MPVVQYLESLMTLSLWSVTQFGLLALITYVLYKRKRKPKAKVYTEEEKQRLIDNFHPEPLEGVEPVPADHYALNPKYVQGKMGHYLKIDERERLNCATFDFLGLVGEARIEQRAKETIRKYGVGSCGPRGFYGTVDVHLDLEKQVSEFMGAEESALYSYGFATISSAIPAFSKRGDVIFADEMCNFAIQKGLQASRSTIKTFKHNDMEDLERLLREQAEWDKKNAAKAKTVRRFFVVEGVYVNSGAICPLPRLLELKYKYKVRIFIDESVSFGVLGDTGRGLIEYFGIKIDDIDMIMVSMENTLSSTGGFCVGRSFVIDHHRLSGLGYCFSASLPPLLATAASESLKIIEEQPERIARLHANCQRVHAELSRALQTTPGWQLVGAELSPLKHIRCADDVDDATAEERLDKIVDYAFERDIALTRARYLAGDEKAPVRPSIRLALNSELTDAEINKLLETLRDAIATL